MPSPPMLLPFPIPDSILLLIHLHLLQWPQADLPCDPDAFNANRHGIGERIKSMEHIIYFLIEKIEGIRGAKTVTPINVSIIHALVVCHSKVENIQQNYVETLKGACVAQNIDLFHMLVDQPEDYKSLTQRIQSIQIRMKVEEVSLKQRAHQVAALQTPRPTEGTLNISLDELQNSRDSLFQKLESGLENLSTEGTGATSTLSWLFSLSKTTGTPTSEATPSAPGNGETNKRRLTARKTILPPPPLPTAVAQHPSYIDMLNELEPQLNDFSAGIPDDVHEGQKGKEPSRDLALFALATDQEANLTASLEQFKAEMIQLATLVDQQLQIKEAAAIDEYMSAKQEELEENNHEQGEPSESMLPNLWTLDHELDLNFEFLSERKSFALSVLSGFRSEIMAGIRSSIQVPFQREEDIESVSSSSIMDEGDVGGEEDGGLDSSSDDKDADQSVVNPSMRSPLKSPQKTSKIPLYVQTPKSSGERKVPALPQTITPPRSNILLQSLATPKARNYTSGPSKRRSQAGLRTPPPRDVMATPSFFFSPSKNMENLKDILPPFQSPWRSVTRSRTYNHSPRKSGRVSIGRPRLSIHRPRLSGARLGSSSSFIRTPLKSGKRLSNIIAPIQYTPIHRLGNATPRASLDDVYEEVNEGHYISLFVKLSTVPFRLSTT
ncbi:hypothetical protein FRC16_009257 [Serendipita sp. 398]|nr:hypothetical protein FRC16_009257 [Serendipita sp. 398]